MQSIQSRPVKLDFGIRKSPETCTNVGAATFPEASIRRRRKVSGRFEEGEEGGFVEDLDAELAGFVELGAGLFAGDDVVGLLGDGAGDLAAGGFDAGLGVVAGEGGQRAGEDEGEAGERGGGDALFGGAW